MHFFKTPVSFITLILLLSSFSYAQQTHEVAPDNSGTNGLAESKNQPTPQDQGSGVDTELTRKMREEITSKSDFSTDAKNVKIIVTSGHVTLRGPVKTLAEKTEIGKIAKKFAKGPVSNQIKVITTR